MYAYFTNITVLQLITGRDKAQVRFLAGAPYHKRIITLLWVKTKSYYFLIFLIFIEILNVILTYTVRYGATAILFGFNLA